MTDTLALIRHEIASRNWTTARLEAESGVSHRAAWNIVRGESRGVDWRTLDRILDALDIRLAHRNERT
jgi:transcriptional regulator with XRE-family HTH domain